MKRTKEESKEYFHKYYNDPKRPDRRIKRIVAGRKYKHILKIEVFKHYSPDLVCQRCGFSDLRALTLDHINGGGLEEKKRTKVVGGHGLYQWVKRNNYPNYLQVLCMNLSMDKTP